MYLASVDGKYESFEPKRVAGRDSVYLHREIYIKHYGKIPAFCEVHHIDGNHNNNAPENLIAVSVGVHKEIHRKGKDCLPNRQQIEDKMVMYNKALEKRKRLMTEINSLREELRRLDRTWFRLKRRHP